MGNRHRSARASPGFTLLELLVVLAIIGLMAGLVGALVMPDERALLRTESERLAHLLELAAEEARLGGRAIAWTVQAPGYRFLEHDGDRGWREMRGRDLFRSRALPAGITIAGLRIENTIARPPLRLEFATDGSASAFTIELASGRARAQVAGSPIGAIAVVAEGDGDDAADRG